MWRSWIMWLSPLSLSPFGRQKVMARKVNYRSIPIFILSLGSGKTMALCLMLKVSHGSIPSCLITFFILLLWFISLLNGIGSSWDFRASFIDENKLFLGIFKVLIVVYNILNIIDCCRKWKDLRLTLTQQDHHRYKPKGSVIRFTLYLHLTVTWLGSYYSKYVHTQRLLN